MRRLPVKLKEPVGNADYTDSKFPHVRFSKGPGLLYTVRNEGPFRDQNLYWDADDGAYFRAQGNGADYDQGPVDLATVADAQVDAADGAAAELLTDYEVGARGAGVAHVAAQTTLRTSGLITCMAWLLYNDRAAYLTHIVIGTPGDVQTDGLAAQVEALSEQFTRATGAAPTHLLLQVALGTRYRSAELTDWMKALVPAGVAAPRQVVHGASKLAHTVHPGGDGAPAYWEGAPIVVVEKSQ